MFGSIFDHARLTIDASIEHYAGLVAVILPIAVAFGFATGATFLVLSEAYGPVAACAMLAAVYLVIAFILAMVVVSYDRRNQAMLRQAAQQSALVSGLLAATPAAISGGGAIARAVGLKTPLLIGSALLAAALLSKSTSDNVGVRS